MPITVAVSSRVAFTVVGSDAAPAREVVGQRRRRKMSPETGRAIEMLGHAIDYLADELALECATGEVRVRSGAHPRVVAIEMLKARNREVYLSCPEAPSLGERLNHWLRATLGLRLA